MEEAANRSGGRKNDSCGSAGERSPQGGRTVDHKRPTPPILLHTDRFQENVCFLRLHTIIHVLPTHKSADQPLFPSMTERRKKCLWEQQCSSFFKNSASSPYFDFSWNVFPLFRALPAPVQKAHQKANCLSGKNQTTFTSTNRQTGQSRKHFSFFFAKTMFPRPCPAN